MDPLSKIFAPEFISLRDINKKLLVFLLILKTSILRFDRNSENRFLLLKNDIYEKDFGDLKC